MGGGCKNDFPTCVEETATNLNLPSTCRCEAGSESSGGGFGCDNAVFSDANANLHCVFNGATSSYNGQSCAAILRSLGVSLAQTGLRSDASAEDLPDGGM